MIKLFFLLAFVLISSKDTLGLQNILVGVERGISQSLHNTHQFFHMPKRASSAITLKHQTLTSEVSKNRTRVVTSIVEPSELSRAPRILTCHKARQSDSGKWQPKNNRVTIPTYAFELSQWVLNRRLNQLPPDIEQNSLKDTLRERFDYQNIWLSITSNSVFDLDDYRVIVNHTNVDTRGRYYGMFDLFLRDAPQRLWIEGKMDVSDIRFEEGVTIRDAYDLSYSYQVLINELFPHGLLEAHLSGETVSKADRTPEMEKFIRNVLGKNRLNQQIFWEIQFIPFINSSPKGVQLKNE